MGWWVSNKSWLMTTLIIIQHVRRPISPSNTHMCVLATHHLKFKRHFSCHIRTLMEFGRYNSEPHYYEPLPQMIHETEANLPRIESVGDEGLQSLRRRYCRRCCGAEMVGSPWSGRSPWCWEEGGWAYRASRLSRDRNVSAVLGTKTKILMGEWSRKTGRRDGSGRLWHCNSE